MERNDQRAQLQHNRWRVPIICAAMIARKLNDKTVDMDCHAVPPPDYRAGGATQSVKNYVCQQDPQTFTITATGAS